jgi:hypothetical protein
VRNNGFWDFQTRYSAGFNPCTAQPEEVDMDYIRFLWLPSIFILTLLLSLPGNAFQSHPNESPKDSRLAEMAGFRARVSQEASERFLYLFKSPVHEAVTQAAYGCTKDELIDCAKKNHASRAMIWGARWNDDPPFRMKSGPSVCKCEQTIRANTQPSCWYALFKDGEKKAASGKIFGPGYAMLYRVHFGDLQFLHAMASQDGEAAEATRAKIMMWAEFTWGVATQTLARDRYIRELGVPGLGAHFPGDQSATILFSLGYPGFQNSKISEVALGSLLHMVQDSFSNSHVTRADPLGDECNGMPGVLKPGMIRQFHSYARQDHEKHNAADDEKAAELHRTETAPCAVDVCRTIIEMWERKATWPEAKKYFDFVFALHPSVMVAGAGQEFEE